MAYTRVGRVDESRSYIYDSTLLAWVPSPAPGGSGISSTQVNISSVTGRVAAMPHSTDYASCGGFHFDSSGALTIGGTITAQAGSTLSTAFASMQISDGSTWVSDSTERAIRVVGGSSLAPVFVKLASTAVGWEVKNVTGSALNVGGTLLVSSLAGAVIMRSSAADALGTVYQSSFANLCASVHNSTIGDLLASVQQNSTVWQTQAKMQDSSGVGPNIVGTRPTTGAQGFAVRTVLNDLQSTCFSTMGNNSTSSTIVSSAATPLRVKVYAYSITSTVQAINTLSFASSLANPIWCVQMQSMSSGITGANLAVSPPAWLFATEASSPLVFKVTGTTGTYHLSVSYFIEA